MFRWLMYVVLRSISVPRNLLPKKFYFAMMSNHACYGILCLVFIDSGSLARLRAERGLFHQSIDAVSCSGTIFLCWLDNMFCMRFSLMINA